MQTNTPKVTCFRKINGLATTMWCKVQSKELGVNGLKQCPLPPTHVQSGSVLSRLIQVTVLMSTSSVSNAAVQGQPGLFLAAVFFFLFLLNFVYWLRPSISFNFYNSPLLGFVLTSIYIIKHFASIKCGEKNSIYAFLLHYV